MANPSTTGGSGAGTEVLRRRYVASSGETEQILCAGEANHIMTVLNVTISSVQRIVVHPAPLAFTECRFRPSVPDPLGIAILSS